MNSKFIELTSGDEASFFVETTQVEESSELTQATGHVEKEFDKLLKRVKPFCESIIGNFQSLSIKPDSASAEFGLNISGGGGVSHLFICRHNMLFSFQ